MYLLDGGGAEKVLSFLLPSSGKPLIYLLDGGGAEKVLTFLSTFLKQDIF
jgi:hypothetical protein